MKSAIQTKQTIFCPQVFTFLSVFFLKSSVVFGKSLPGLGAIAEQRSLSKLDFAGSAGVQISPIAAWSTRAQLHAEARRNDINKVC